MEKKTANLYIDGYNFYYAITKAADAADKKKEFGDNRIYRGHAWCNFKKLGEQLLQPNELEKVIYYTAEVAKHEAYDEEGKNQDIWLGYLKEYTSIKIIRSYHSGMNPGERKKKKEKLRKALEELRDKIDIILNGIYPKTREDIKNAQKALKQLEIPNYIFNISQAINPKRKEKMTDVNIAVEMIIDSLYDEDMDIAILITGDLDYFSAVKEICNKKDMQVWIPPNSSRKAWDKKKKEYDLDRLTIEQLTPEILANSVLPYKKRGNKEPCDSEKFLPDSIKNEIYNDRNRYWTYDAIKESASKIQKISVDDIVCNVTADEKATLEKINSPRWQRFKENGISMYDYLEGEYKT